MRTRRTVHARWLALSLLAAAVPPSWSQSATQADAPKTETAKVDAKADAKPDPDAAAAMERAQRLANNPLRMIIEASRLRRRDGEAGAEPAEAAPRRIAVRADTSPAGPAARAGVDNAAGDAAPAPPQPALVTLSADATLSQPLALRPSELKADAAPQSVLPMNMAPAPLPAPEMAALLVQPRLVAMTPPEFSPRVVDQVGRIGEVSVELTLRADGSVAEVTVLPPAPRALHRSIVDALLQWRYEPLPAQRRHRVELVFSPGS